MRRLVLLLALLSAPLAAAANASADRPQVFTVPFVDSSVDTDTCGASLPINDTRTGTIRFTTFADDSQIRHGDVTVTLSANGKVLGSESLGESSALHAFRATSSVRGAESGRPWSPQQISLVLRRPEGLCWLSARAFRGTRAFEQERFCKEPTRPTASRRNHGT